MTEAFFAVGQAGQRQARFLRLGQEFLGQVALDEVPIMLLAGEHVGQGQEDGLLSAVLVQSESGDADHVHGVVTGQDVAQDALLVAHDAAVLDVNQNFAAGQLFQLVLEGQGHVADDGAVHGVDLSVGQGHGLGQSRGAGQNHGQHENDAKQFLHEGVPPLKYSRRRRPLRFS